MRRYWIEKKDIQENLVQIRGDLFHHIFDVCRQQMGSRFELLTEDSKAYFVEVIEIGKKTGVARVIEERAIAPIKDPKIHLALSMARFNTIDSVLEKSVELGVSSVQLFFSEFSFIRSEEKLSDNKFDRWEKIIRSATQQTGRGDLMKMNSPVKFEKVFEMINREPDSVGLFAYEGTATLGIKDFVNQKKAKYPQGLKNIWIIVGSEGGFSLQEVEKLKNLGLDPVSLGPQILRVETACMALISVLKYDFDLMC